MYNTANFRFEPDKGIAASALMLGIGSEDGDLQFPSAHSSQLPTNSDYAPIDPFARWRLIVNSNASPGIDLSKLNHLLIDFHGFHETLL